MAPRSEQFPFSQSTRQLSDFLNGIPVPIYRTTLEGEIVFCNAALAECFGYDSAFELIGTQVTGLYQKMKDRGKLIGRILSQGYLSNYVVALRRKNGGKIWCAVTAQAGLDDDDMVIHLDGMLLDVTDRVSSGNASPGAGSPATDASGGVTEKFKGVLEMAGGVVHHLNQPLTVATNLIDELVTGSGSSSEQAEKLSRIQQQIAKLNTITRKIARIHKYASMEYVAGVKIVDIDNASLT